MAGLVSSARCTLLGWPGRTATAFILCMVAFRTRTVDEEKDLTEQRPRLRKNRRRAQAGLTQRMWSGLPGRFGLWPIGPPGRPTLRSILGLKQPSAEYAACRGAVRSVSQPSAAG